MSQLLDYFFGLPDENQQQEATHKDSVIVAMNYDEKEDYDDDDDDVYADDVYSSEDDEEDDYYVGGGDEYKNASRETRRQIDYVVNATVDVYKESHEMISTVYKLFATEYGKRESLNMGALEYIANHVNEEGYNPATNQQGRFRCLFYDTLSAKMYPRVECCRVVDGVSDVFLVNKQLDFVYGRVIEHAILRSDIDLARRAYDRFSMRKHLISPCTSEHDPSIKCCPSEWVLYVNVNSEFFAYCSRVLKQEALSVDFALSPQYVAAERLSFYLVLLLCGHMMTNTVTTTDTEQYTQINQWKKLPVWFLTVWYAGHS